MQHSSDGSGQYHVVMCSDGSEEVQVLGPLLLGAAEEQGRKEALVPQYGSSRGGRFLQQPTCCSAGWRRGGARAPLRVAWEPFRS